MNTGMTTKLHRDPADPTLIESLPEGTTERDYPRFYCLMSYAQFIALLPSTTVQLSQNQ